MKRNVLQFWSIIAVLVLIAPLQDIRGQVVENSNKNSFKVIGYFFPRSSDTAEDISYEYLTHINYAFAIPTKDASGNLEPIPHPEILKDLVKRAHENDVKVFLSVGGWELGDGGGNDSRFEKLADDKETRATFVSAVVDTLIAYNLDGADIDWEYPDAVEPSSSNFIKLMKALKTELSKHKKELTAATVSFQDRNGYGVRKEIFDIVDWLNIMSYDYGSYEGGIGPHSPYWLAVRSLEYWVDDRGLPAEKAVLGVPFYGKGKGWGSYKMLLERGADPYADVKDSVYYNGIKTIKDKTILSKKQGGGIMIWEIKGDVKGKYSLLKTIYETAYSNEE